MDAPAPITNIDDVRWVRALSHPLRIRLLAMLEEQEASPVGLSKKLEQRLGTVSYHVRTLYELGLLELVRTRPRRGATEHFYRARANHPCRQAGALRCSRHRQAGDADHRPGAADFLQRERQ